MNAVLVIVTLISLVVAAAMSIVAWRMARYERRRSDARVAALSADIHDDLPLRDRTTSQSQDLFASAQPASRPSRLGTVIAGGGFLVASVVALVVLLGGGSGDSGPVTLPSGTVVGAGTAPAAATEALNAAALELVALGHDREADRLTVRGIVRNPETGSAVSGLVAVVWLFDRDGGFVASGRAAVEGNDVRPGGETAFVVTIPGAIAVGRYRVSFRTDDRVVPHVDRRDRGFIARVS